MEDNTIDTITERSGESCSAGACSRRITDGYVIPVSHLDKEPGKDFIILNLTDPQLSDAEWDEENGDILKKTVDTLIERERPDLITISGDISFGDQYRSAEIFCDMLEKTGIPWAPVMGNHEYQDGGIHVGKYTEIYSSYKNGLFTEGDPRLGSGNYVIVIRENGAPIHALLMLDTHGFVHYAGPDGEEKICYATLSPEQIGWYRSVCAELSAAGVAETTAITHIPDPAFRTAYEAAAIPGLNPDETETDPDGWASGKYWREGYRDSFGAALEYTSASPFESGFLDALTGCDSTKTVICGHDHFNSFGVRYRGVLFVYGLKTGPGCTWDPRSSGGTVITVSSDGKAGVRHHFVR